MSRDDALQWAQRVSAFKAEFGNVSQMLGPNGPWSLETKEQNIALFLEILQYPDTSESLSRDILESVVVSTRSCKTMFLILHLSGLSEDPKASFEEGVKCLVNLVHQSPICRKVFLDHPTYFTNLCQIIDISESGSLKDFYLKLAFLLTGHSMPLARIALESGLLESLTEILVKNMSLKTHTSSDNDALKIILNMCPILPNPIPSTIPQKLIPVLTNQISIFPYQESSGSNQPFLHSIHILANFAVDTETWLIDKTDLESFIDNLISVLSILLQNAAKGNSETYLFPMESTVVHGLPFTDAILPFFVLFNGLATLSKTFLKCRLFPALSDKNESSKSLQEYLTVLILHAGHSRVREQVEELVFYLFDESVEHLVSYFGYGLVSGLLVRKGKVSMDYDGTR